MPKDDSFLEALEFFRAIAAHIDKMEKEKAENKKEKRGKK